MTELDSDVSRVVAAYISSVWLRPETVVTDTPDWFEIRNPASRMSLHNAVRRCRLPADELVVRIAEVREHHTLRRSAVNWTVNPLDTPGLGEALLLGGFRKSHTMWGMVRGTSPLDEVPEDVVVERIDDAELYASVAQKGWQMDQGFFTEFLLDVRTRIARGDLVAFLARVGGEPVGTGKILYTADTGYLMGGAVVPGFRGRGVYRALVDARLTELRRLGVGSATVVALDRTSGPTCVRMGFRRVGDFEMYRWSV
ncbi:MAG: GNAT family N-acetyltransferase [Proteobacteria bacterium]|nr:GNAT family N-acetyltransferase [Pseudomonadota bacterium]MCP4915636.1 GNAT family N-acetyltransferase [Pseudomonadota bacterium]